MGFLTQVIRTAVISAVGAKLARGRSPIVVALLTLLASRALANRDGSKEEQAKHSGQEQETQGGLGALVERFQKGGLEDLIKSWIGTGANKLITPVQLHQALGPEKIDELSSESGLPRDDLLSQLSRLLPEVIDKLTPNGRLPADAELHADPDDMNAEELDSPLATENGRTRV